MDDDLRVEELLRTNSELAAEIRDLRAGRADGPRSAVMPTARRLARLTEEREKLRVEADTMRAELAHSRLIVDGLQQENRQLIAELAHLRSGFRGLLRRARARLLSRPRG